MTSTPKENTLTNTLSKFIGQLKFKKENHNTLIESNERYAFHFEKIKELDSIIEKAEKLKNESLNIIEIETSKLLDGLQNVKK